MRAAIMTEAGKVHIENVPLPQLQEDELRIKISLAGICGSDHSMYEGKLVAPLPLIPGHEAVGRIDAVGSVDSLFKVGQKVTVFPNCYCGTCVLCQRGLTNICPGKIRIGVDTDGVFAEYITVPELAACPVPESIDDESAVFIEPLAVALHAFNQSQPQNNDNVLVLGAGVIGQLTLQLTLLKAPRVMTCDLEPVRLDLAGEMGASAVLGGNEFLEEYENSFDLIYETTGAPTALAQSIHLAAPGGRIVILGLPGKGHVIPTEKIVRKELKIFGSMIYTNEFKESMSLLKQGLMNTEGLISNRIKLEELGESLKEFKSPYRMKTLINIG